MLQYWLWLYQMNGFSRRQKLELLQHFEDPETIYQCQRFDHIPNLTQEQTAALQNKDLREVKILQNVCLRKNIGILTLSDENYPRRLRNIPEPPLLLFYKGVLPDFEKQPAIGVVGTRKATSYGVGVAKKFGAQLSASGSIVVSGGAAGVDTAALKGALDVQGQTVAVLGCGVDITYPISNRKLFMQIQEQGCLMSEYLPGTSPKPWQFPERNRIISGLSNGVLIIEAPEKSGALITARDALEQGRDVYAVPGNIDMSSCAGSNALLGDGAAAVFTGWDILKQYAAQYPDSVQAPVSGRAKTVLQVAQPTEKPTFDKKDIDNPANNPYSVKIDDSSALTPAEETVLSVLSRTPVAMDDVMAQLDLPAAEVLQIITKLSLDGKVINHPGRLVSLR
ncbi:MAG: DNA-processing protein DprA [Oscillospiraceae bacterium]|nr:DNA-processing protein DprA [Oscillospiraceae bacterium]